MVSNEYLYSRHRHAIAFYIILVLWTCFFILSLIKPATKIFTILFFVSAAALIGTGSIYKIRYGRKKGGAGEQTRSACKGGSDD